MKIQHDWQLLPQLKELPQSNLIQNIWKIKTKIRILSFYYHIVKTEHLLLNINYLYVQLRKVSFFFLFQTFLFCMQDKILSQTVSENARLELNSSKYTSGSENNGILLVVVRTVIISYPTMISNYGIILVLCWETM